ncbi:MAG: hypothetical protein QOF18_1110, partial [Frankiaceae bacterium]|nr:hypothetical protein [Frankiaceae bacterium]
ASDMPGPVGFYVGQVRVSTAPGSMVRDRDDVTHVLVAAENYADGYVYLTRAHDSTTWTSADVGVEPGLDPVKLGVSNDGSRVYGALDCAAMDASLKRGTFTLLSVPVTAPGPAHSHGVASTDCGEGNDPPCSQACYQTAGLFGDGHGGLLAIVHKTNDGPTTSTILVVRSPADLSRSTAHLLPRQGPGHWAGVAATRDARTGALVVAAGRPERGVFVWTKLPDARWRGPVRAIPGAWTTGRREPLANVTVAAAGGRIWIGLSGDDCCGGTPGGAFVAGRSAGGRWAAPRRLPQTGLHADTLLLVADAPHHKLQALWNVSHNRTGRASDGLWHGVKRFGRPWQAPRQLTAWFRDRPVDLVTTTTGGYRYSFSRSSA